jgi:hypothetical protein
MKLARQSPARTENQLLLPMGTWVVLLLSLRGQELARTGRLAARLRADLRAPAQFPVLVADADGAGAGYVFLGTGLPAERYLRLEGRPYAEQVLSREVRGQRVLQLVEKHEMMGMLAEPREPELRRGVPVKVVSGCYFRVRGRVLQPRYPDAQSLAIQVRTRTLCRLLILPRRLVEPIEDKTVPPLRRARRPSLAGQNEQLRLGGSG